MSWTNLHPELIVVEIQSKMPTGENLIKHGMAGTPLHKVWMSMISRCRDKHPFSKYIQRGITVCKEWGDFMVFYRDMSPTYRKGLQLDRIDNDLGYSKENCRWVTPKQNARNRSDTLFTEYKGERKPLVAWSDEIGIAYDVLIKRIKVRGWSIERAFNTPIFTARERGLISVLSPNHINNRFKAKK